MVNQERAHDRPENTRRQTRWRKPMMVWTLVAVVVLGGAWTICHWFGVDSLLRRQKGARVGNAVWEDKGPTPLGEKGYTPQGITWVRGKLIFANTWKNTKSRVYEIEPGSMRIERTFDMPPGAVHTSGLAWDGAHLWAVDYKSNRAYCIDLEGSLAAGEVRVLGEFDTTLQGTSACCIIPWKGRDCLAISDFMRTRRTLFVNKEEAVKTGTARDNIEFDYRNEGFSQGLEYVDGYLYESENKWGINAINKMSLEKLQQTRDAWKATVTQYAAPSKGVEDLAWDGEAFWTSDESVFRFFRGKLERQEGGEVPHE
jgi:glutamine cyclotransferase